MSVMHIIGGYATDQVFTIETDEGEITWNVTKLEAAASAGAFGAAEIFTTSDLSRPIYDNVDHDKIEAIKYLPEVLNKPIIGIGRKTGPGDVTRVRCIVDGNHRIIARQELRLPTFSMFIVPPEIEHNFRVTFLTLQE